MVERIRNYVLTWERSYVFFFFQENNKLIIPWHCSCRYPCLFHPFILCIYLPKRLYVCVCLCVFLSGGCYVRPFWAGRNYQKPQGYRCGWVAEVWSECFMPVWRYVMSFNVRHFTNLKWCIGSSGWKLGHELKKKGRSSEKIEYSTKENSHVGILIMKKNFTLWSFFLSLTLYCLPSPPSSLCGVSEVRASEAGECPDADNTPPSSLPSCQQW